MEQVSNQQLIADSTATKAVAGPEFIVGRNDLLKELSELHKVAQRKATVPILANIMMQAFGAVLALTASDLDVSLRTVCPARVKKEGACTIPAQKLYDYVRLLEDEVIAFRVLENKWVQIRSGRSHTKMPALTPESFPNLSLF